MNSERRIRLSVHLTVIGVAIFVAGLMVQGAILVTALLRPSAINIFLGHSFWRSLLIDLAILPAVVVVFRRRQTRMKEKSEERAGIEPLSLTFTRGNSS